VEGDEPITIIGRLKYYLKNRKVHLTDTHLKYAWYVYTRYIMELAIEEKIRSVAIAEAGSDNQPIRYRICIAGQDSNYDERRNEREYCQLWQHDTPDKSFPLQLEDFAEAASTSCIGRPMTNQNYFVYIQP
jgi:hypothetical protein